MRVFDEEPLAPRTTLRVGGTARRLVEVDSEAEIVSACKAYGRQCIVIGAGSNLIVSDQGLQQTVLAICSRGIEQASDGPTEVTLTAQAGEPWERFVRYCVERDLAGLECMAGIPGLVGATPIQNVGAYGQQVSDCIRWVRVFDHQARSVRQLLPNECRFGYRDSRFKSQEPGRFVVLSVCFGLRRGGPSPPTYPELRQALDATPALSLRGIRLAVLQLRAAKSMLLDERDPNSRSAGSFFVNPVVSQAQAQAVARRAQEADIIAELGAMPSFEASAGVKLSAAWLIEAAGFKKGYRDGLVGLSTRHALALVTRPGCTAADVHRLAGRIIEAVDRRFGVRLSPEPRWIGPEPSEKIASLAPHRVEGDGHTPT